MVFLRYGLYKDAKLKFTIDFEAFPEQLPTVKFLSEVFHPMVDPKTGKLDLAHTFKNWSYGSEHLVFHIIEHIRYVFLDNKFYEVEDSLNPEAVKLYKMAID